MEHAVQLRVLRRVLAERCGGRDTVDVEGVARVLGVRNGVRNERLLVHDARGLREVDHRVRVHLLRARVRVREESVDAVDARERDARAVGHDVAAADEAEILPALRDGRQVSLRDALGDGGLRETPAGLRALARFCSARRRSSLATV